MITDKGLSFNQKSGFRSGIGCSIGPGSGVSRSVRGLSFDRSVVRPGVGPGQSFDPTRSLDQGFAASVPCPRLLRPLSPQHPSLVRVRVPAASVACPAASVPFPAAQAADAPRALLVLVRPGPVGRYCSSPSSLTFICMACTICTTQQHGLSYLHVHHADIGIDPECM